MKRRLTPVIALVVLALFVAGCGDDGDGDDASSDDSTATTRPEDPKSNLIAERSMLTADDFPVWWEESEIDGAVGLALVRGEPTCEGAVSAVLGAETDQNAAAGPVSFQETDGVGRLDAGIKLFTDVAQAEAFMAALESSDAVTCLTNVLNRVFPDSVESADWVEPAPVGDEAVAIDVNLTTSEPVTMRYIWVRIDRAVLQVNYTGLPDSKPDDYVSLAASRLNEQFTDVGASD